MTMQILLSLAFLAAVLYLTVKVPVRKGAGFPETVSFLPPAAVFCGVLAVSLVLRLLLGYSINLALHDGLTLGDVDMFLS